MTYLMRCPFCGGDPVEDTISLPKMTGHIVFCNECSVAVPAEPTEALAHSHWNRREMPPSDEIARLKVELAATRLRVTGLEATLAPFAKAADRYRDIPGVSLTHHDVELWQQPTKIQNSGLTVGDLRRASAILGDAREGGST